MKAMRVILLLSVLFAAQALTAGENKQDEIRFQKAVQAFEAGNPDESIRLFGEALKLNPDFADAYWNRAIAYMSQKKYALAEKDLQQVTKLAPEFDDGFGYLAWMRILQGKFSDAMGPAEMAHKLDKKKFMWTANLGHAWLLNGDQIKAKNFYLRAIYLVKQKDEYQALKDDFALFKKNNWMPDSVANTEHWITRVYDQRDLMKEARRLNHQVLKLFKTGKYAEAITTAKECARLRKQVLGDNDYLYATSLNNLAVLYKSTGSYAKALPLYEQALAIRKKSLGEGHPDYATSLNNLALLYESMGSYAKALPLYKEALVIDKKALGEDHSGYATDLNNLAVLYESMGSHAKALPLYEQALAIRKKSLGEDHSDYAQSLSNLAGLYESLGSYAKALPLYKQALAIDKKALGENHPDYASILNNLAALHESMGSYGKALPLYKQALAIKKALGEGHPDYASSLNNLAALYSAMGLYEKALPLYKQALRVRKKALGEEHPDYALSLNSLAELYRVMGSYTKALPLNEQALAINKKAFGEDHPGYAQSLNNLAVLYESMGSYGKALPLYKQTLAIRKKALGEEHSDYASSLNLLAGLYRVIGSYGKALPLYKQALAIRKKALGEDHPDYALSLNNLALLYNSMGSYAKALPLYEQASEVYKKALGEGHPEYATILINQGILLATLHKPYEALNRLIQAQTILSYHIARSFSVMTEKQKLAFVQVNEWGYHATLSLIQNNFLGDAKAAAAGLDLVLVRKGIVFDAQARQSEAIANSLDSETKKLWDDLSMVRRTLSGLLQHKPSKMDSETYKSRIKAEQKKAAELESQLAGKSALVAEQVKQRKVTANTLAAVLGQDDVLAEFVRIRDYDWENHKWAKSYRYLVFVLKHDGSVQLVNLGDADALESKVQATLKSLGVIGTDPKLQEEASRALYDVIWQPLEKAVGGAKSVIVSPDGLLNLVPFNAMRNQSGKYLIESKQIAYVTSGRDLAKGDVGMKPEQTLYLAANPQFDLTVPSGSGRNQTSDTTRSASFSMHFSQLPGTELEAKAIPAYLAGKKTIVVGKAATESNLMHAKSSKVIHLATHGFFLKDQPSLVASNTRGAVAMMDEDDEQAVVSQLPKGYENPMVRSGLALAGANHAKDSNNGDDGLLTALEVSGMNLHATDLVTLSACETGRGEVKTGDGVYGLRRAFALAGVKNLVMSLWAVSDDVTATQMQQFYQAYGKGESPAQAMRSAQLNTIKGLRDKKGFAAPALWAPFMVQGN